MRFGASVEKATLFRAFQQPFANVYHYEAPTIAPTALVDLENLLDQIVAFEKTIHATDVNFLRARLWSTGTGSQATNQMLVDKDLTGTGSGTNSLTLDRERAILIRWPAGTNSRGRPVYLRKWYHVCGTFTGFAISNGVLQQTAMIDGASRTTIENKADDIQTLELSATPVAELCAQSGRETTGQGQAHPYLEHRQLGDQWR